MASVRGQRRAGWMWPVIILLAVILLGLIAWALLAPSAPVTQPIGTAPAPAPAAAPAQTTIGDITGNPASFYSKDVIVEASIIRTVGDQGFYLADTSNGSELLAVLGYNASKVDLTTGNSIRFSGNVRLVIGDELSGLVDIVDQPTLNAVANEKAYLLIAGFEKISP